MKLRIAFNGTAYIIQKKFLWWWVTYYRRGSEFPVTRLTFAEAEAEMLADIKYKKDSRNRAPYVPVDKEMK